MDDRLRGSCYTLHRRVSFLSLVESAIRLHRDRSPDRAGVFDQLGRRAVYKLRGCNFMDRRRHLVVARGIELLSTSPVAVNIALARLLTVHHLQRHGCFQRRTNALAWPPRMFDPGLELGFD